MLCPLNFHFFTGKAISIVKGLRSHFCSAGNDPVISVHYSNIDRMWTKQFIILFHPYSINIRGINMEIFDKLFIKLANGLLPRYF
ncbi:hypothetical protein OIU76_011502 [Salix suchowensis]|nr:hypothetical protein OIU76_011502 [Salix suchowensis]